MTIQQKCPLCEGFKTIYDFGGIKKDCPTCRPDFSSSDAKVVTDLLGSMKPPVASKSARKKG